MKLFLSGIGHLKTKEGGTMFDITRVGRKITELRKKNNMTQMELADRMGISFQAVSNWERGQTMPDIAKLYELSEIFGVPIDEILENSRGAEILKAVEQNRAPETPLTAEELADVAPVLKPNQVDNLLDGLGDLSLRDLAVLMPFVEQDTVDTLAKKALADENAPADLVAVMPFVSDETADELFRSMAGKFERTEQLTAIAPFVSEGAVDDCVLRALERDPAQHVAALAPFMSEQAVSKAAILKMKQGGIASIAELLPFMDSSVLSDSLKGKS